MASDKMSSNGRSEDSIPPPSDPFPTYQTPYPQKPSHLDEPNPFVAFRRFADSQFSTFFSQISSLLGQTGQTSLSKPEQPPQHRIDKSLRQWDEQLAAQTARFEDQLCKMVRKRHEEAEGYWKEVEQEWEERRMRNERRMKDVQDQLTKRLSEFDKHLPASRREADTELDLYRAGEPSRRDTDKAVKDVTALNGERAFPFSDFPPWSIFHPRNSSQAEPSDLPPWSIFHPRNSSEATASGIGPQVAKYSPPVFSPVDALLWWTGSKYSPMRLKNSTDSRTAELVDWEAAFEDLVLGDHAYESDRLGLSKDQQAHEKAWGTTLLEARQAAQTLGLFADVTSRVKNHQINTLSNWVSDLEKALVADWKSVWGSDRVESLFKFGESEAASNMTAHHTASSHSIDKTEQSPDTPIATYTTTRTSQRSDGTFEITKTTKTRYADGREESSESFDEHQSDPVENSISNSSQHGDPMNKALGVEELPTVHPGAKVQANKIGKGWFWN